MMQLRNLIEKMQPEVPSISRDQSLHAAVMQMAAGKIPALVVMDASRPVGILTGNDVLKSFATGQDTPLQETTVHAAMSKMISAIPDEPIARAVEMMFMADAWHLAVIEAESILALFSLFDLAKASIHELTAELAHLHDYIDDLHDAAKD